MVDPACGISARCRVDHATIVQLEEERVIRIVRIAVRSPLRFIERDPLTAVFDDSRALADRAPREDAAAVDRRMADDVSRRLARGSSGHR